MDLLLPTEKIADEYISHVSRSASFSRGRRRIGKLKFSKWQGPSLATGLEARTWGPDPKLSELNLQSKLNQPAKTVGGSDLAEVAVSHSSARQSVVCVIEQVEHLRFEDQIGPFGQGESLARVEVHVLE